MSSNSSSSPPPLAPSAVVLPGAADAGIDAGPPLGGGGLVDGGEGPVLLNNAILFRLFVFLCSDEEEDLTWFVENASTLPIQS